MGFHGGVAAAAAGAEAGVGSAVAGAGVGTAVAGAEAGVGTAAAAVGRMPGACHMHMSGEEDMVVAFGGCRKMGNAVGGGGGCDYSKGIVGHSWAEEAPACRLHSRVVGGEAVAVAAAVARLTAAALVLG